MAVWFLLLTALLLFLSIAAWRIRQNTQQLGSSEHDLTGWLLFGLALLAAFGFGALLVYIWL